MLYFECAMGAAGDMIMASLLDLLPDKRPFLEQMNNLLPGISVTCSAITQADIRGLRMSIAINGEEEESHDYSGGAGTESVGEFIQAADHHAQNPVSLVEGMSIPDAVKRNAVSILRLLMDVQSEVHGEPVSEIHFHPLGNLDAVVDIVGVCLLIDALSPISIVVSPIHVGSGQVMCRRGVLPVPAPATARILSGVPTYGGAIKGELCTPTGAAILRWFASEFCDMQGISPATVGRGFGKKEFSCPSYVSAAMCRA